jgi:hypothetical protein
VGGDEHRRADGGDRTADLEAAVLRHRRASGVPRPAVTRADTFRCALSGSHDFGMDLLARELPTGRWGEQYETGVVDGLLETALVVNACVQAFASAYHAESAGGQEVEAARLTAERGVTAGVRQASAVQRFGVVAEYSEALLQEWARMALHLARVTTTAWRLHADEPPAAATGGQRWLRDIEPVSALYSSRSPLLRSLALEPVPGRTGADNGPGPDLGTSYQAIVDAVNIGLAHRTPPELFDRNLSGDHDAVVGLGLLDLAIALHDYGAQVLWLLAARTTAR